MTEPDEKPELFLPKTTVFFTVASLLLMLVFLAILVLGLVELHWFFSGPAD